MSYRRREAISKQPVTIWVDGQPSPATANQNLLEASGQADINTPHLYYHPALGAIQPCDRSDDLFSTHDRPASGNV